MAQIALIVCVLLCSLGVLVGTRSMPRCYTPPDTPKSSRKSPATWEMPDVIAKSTKCVEEHTCLSTPNSAILTRIPLANHPVPSLDIPWTGIEPHPSSSNGCIDNEALNSQLHEILQMLRSNFGKIHLHNAGLMTKLQFSEDYMRASSPGTRKSKSKASSLLESDLSIIEESNPQHPILAKGQSLLSSDPSTKQSARSQEASMKLNRGDSKLNRGASMDEREKVSMSTATSPKPSGMSMGRMGSQLRDLEKLAGIISKHSGKHRRSTVVQQTWVFFENRSSSKWAYFYGSYFAPFFLVLSVMMSFMQTVDGWKMPENTFSAIQSGFELWFGLEISIRFAVCPTKASFWFNGFNLIDLISVMPLFVRVYVWVIMQECTCDIDIIHRIVALVPMLRLLKILRRFHKFQLLLSAFWIAVEALPVLIFSLCLLAIMFSGLIFLIEDRDLIPSLPSALWFVIVTMTTVGYGDVVPQTTPGKFVTAMLMISSALYMALPIGIVGNAFSEVWKDRDRLLLISVLRESFAISGVSRQLVKELFHEFLEDGERSEDSDPYAEPEMNVAQFLRMLRALQIDVTEARATALFQALDVDSGGTITCDEFIKRLFPSAYLAGQRRSSFRRPKSLSFMFTNEKSESGGGDPNGSAHAAEI